MKDTNKNVELLAPAQNLICAKAAINCGADAVYIGASNFGARKNAGNNLDDIGKLVQYAHKFNVKIYVTVNTILNDNELKEAVELINELEKIGVDAIIIQDMGLLNSNLPDIEIHASTQCNIRTKEKVKFFEKLGIKRAILARELNINQIREIRDGTNIELECFVHGALCVSYSGQCYMSTYIGGRSANKGECAQACRKKYSLANDKGKVLIKDKYLLSLKDFCAKDYIKELIDAGVTSFKIEGRLKDEIYVKNVVLYYRNLIDNICKNKPSDGEIYADFTPDINKTFNRGYTSYFLGENKNISTIKTPKSRGELLGKVNLIDKKYFTISFINTKTKINSQDGLCYLTNDGLKGFLVNKIEGNKIFPNCNQPELKKEVEIYRNQNVEFENKIKNSKTKRLILVTFTIKENEIILSDGKNEIVYKIKNNELAHNKEKMKENIQNCLKKTGNSIFAANKVIFKTENMPFMPLSKLNKIRHEMFLKLEDLRLKNYKKYATQLKLKKPDYKEKPTDYRLNIHNKKAFEFYQKCGIKPFEYSVEKTRNFKGKEIMRCKYCIRRSLNLCLKNNPKNKGELFLIDEKNVKYPLVFDCKNCEMAIIAP